VDLLSHGERDGSLLQLLPIPCGSNRLVSDHRKIDPVPQYRQSVDHGYGQPFWSKGSVIEKPDLAALIFCRAGLGCLRRSRTIPNDFYGLVRFRCLPECIGALRIGYDANDGPASNTLPTVKDQ